MLKRKSTRKVARRTNRRFYRKRRSYRTVGRQLIPRINVSSFKRMFWAQNWAFSTATTAGFHKQISPTFGLLPNQAEYTVLFDQFKLNGIKMTFVPRWNSADAGPSATVGQNMAYITYTVDGRTNYSPSGTYTSANYNVFLETAQGKVKTKMLDKPFSLYFKPVLSQQEYIGNWGNSGSFVGPKWLSTANDTTITHRGPMFFMHDANFAGTITNWSVDIFYTYYFQCRGNK